MDGLARQGARFTNGYASAPLCSPTRVALLTGLYQQRVGNSFEDYMGGGFPGLDATTHPSLAAPLKAAGYRTAVFGKWNVSGGKNEDKPEVLPAAHGFEHWFGVHANHDQHTHLREKMPVHDLWENGKAIERTGYTDDLVTDEAVSFIGKHRGEPFFVFLPYLSPHNPLQTHDDPKVHAKDDRAVYVKMVEHLDSNVGRVLAAIHDLGLDERTLVMLTSDNGGQQAARCLPFSGRKGQLLEGGIRVPFILRQTGVIAAGQTIDYPVITMDLTATALAAGRAQPSGDQPLDGIDLLPIVKGNIPAEPRTLYFRLRKVDFKTKQNDIVARAIREGDWKVYFRDEKVEKLFNLRDDITESNDLHEKHPEIAERLSNKLASWERAVTPPGELFAESAKPNKTKLKKAKAK
jgi:arylsulfatase A-like enzyme